MNFEEILKELEKFNGSDDLNKYISGQINSDMVKVFLETDEGKKLLQPMLDSFFSKGLETWKTNNLTKLVDDKVKELYPEADPKDKELAALKAEMEQMKATALREKLTNQVLKLASEKGVPSDFADYLIATDEESTIKRFNDFESIYSKAISNSVNEKLKGAGYTPPDDHSDNLDGVSAAFMSINPNIQI